MCSFPYSDVISMKIRWKNEDNHVILLMDYWLRTNLDGTCIIAYWIKYFSFFVSEKYIDRFLLILFIIYLIFPIKSCSLPFTCFAMISTSLIKTSLVLRHSDSSIYYCLNLAIVCSRVTHRQIILLVIPMPWNSGWFMYSMALSIKTLLHILDHHLGHRK